MPDEGRHARSSFFAQKKGQKAKTTNPSFIYTLSKRPFNASFFGVFAKSDGLTIAYKQRTKPRAKRDNHHSTFLLLFAHQPLPGTFPIFSLPP